MTEPMPVFTIKAKDALAVEAVRAYRALCVKYGLTEQAGEVQFALSEIADWQTANPQAVKMPDHKHVAVTRGECASCGEVAPDEARCPKSHRSCGHHCNHVWTHDACCWCGITMSAEDGSP